MTVVAATSFLLGLYDAEAPGHRPAAALYAGLDEDLVTTPLVVAALERSIAGRWGSEHLVPLLDDLDSGAIGVRWWSTAMAEAIALVRSGPAGLGLTDASLLALAPVVRTTRIATLDPGPLAAARLRDGANPTLLPDKEHIA